MSREHSSSLSLYGEVNTIRHVQGMHEIKKMQRRCGCAVMKESSSNAMALKNSVGGDQIFIVVLARFRVRREILLP